MTKNGNSELTTAAGSLTKEEDSQPFNTDTASPLLSLPAPKSDPSSGDSAQRTDGENAEVLQTIRMDQLGPLVINSDGTLSRINNWSSMTKAERERTLRVLGKRNMLRKEKLTSEESTEQ